MENNIIMAIGFGSLMLINLYLLIVKRKAKKRDKHTKNAVAILFGSSLVFFLYQLYDIFI